jgi:hypothetical protein
MAERLVGIFGFKRSGKDSLADQLVNNFGYTKLHFANPLRQIMQAFDPIIDTERDGGPIRLNEKLEEFGWEAVKTTYPEVRRIMQKLGTEGCREILGPYTWIAAMDRAMQAVDGPVVIADGRFLNESEFVRDWGGIVVRMNRRWGVPQEEDPHPSEGEIGLIVPDMDIIIEGGLDEVRSYAKDVNDLSRR